MSNTIYGGTTTTPIPIKNFFITGEGMPTIETKGTVGQLYIDTTNFCLYKCTGSTYGMYYWEQTHKMVTSDELDEYLNYTELGKNSVYPSLGSMVKYVNENASGGGGSVGIVDNLESEDTNKALSANMGRELLEEINQYTTVVAQNNLLPVLDVAGNSYDTGTGVTLTVDEKGVFTLNGTSNQGHSIEIIPAYKEQSRFATLKAGKEYTLQNMHVSGEKTSGNLMIYVNDINKVSVGAGSTKAVTINKDQDTILARFAISIAASTTFTDYKFAPYLVLTEQYNKNYVGGARFLADNKIYHSPSYTRVVSELLPEYLQEEARIVSNKNIAQTSDLNFLVFADPHSYDDSKYLKYAELMKNGGIDFMVGLGDYNPYVATTKENVLMNLNRVLSKSGRERNNYYAIGNHDMFYNMTTTKSALSKKEQHKLFCSHLNGTVRFNELDPYGCYYYTDYDVSKIRIIVLNTSDNYTETGELNTSSKLCNTIMIGQKQLTWFAEEALDFTGKATPTDWSVLVFAHVYRPVNADILPSILKAAKNGTSIKKTWTDDGNNLSVNVDYSTQGAIDVIGFAYGHDHNDETIIHTSGINCIQFRSDSAELDDIYIAPIDGIAGDGTTLVSHYITTIDGKKLAFNVKTPWPTAKFITYNNYLPSNGQNYTRVEALDENGVTLYAYKAEESKWTEASIEIATGFTPMRTKGTATTESCSIVNVDKETRTITVVPYGVSQPRVIAY